MKTKKLSSEEIAKLGISATNLGTMASEMYVCGSDRCNGCGKCRTEREKRKTMVERGE